MRRNEGSVDRIVRLVLGAFLAVLAFIVGAPWLQVILGVLAGIALFTGAVGFCALYVPFGIDTSRGERSREEHTKGCCG